MILLLVNQRVVYSMSKYIYLKLNLRDGENEHASETVLEVTDDRTIDEVANDYLKEFWGDGEPYNEEDANDNSVEYPNGIVGSIDRCHEIPKEHYDILKRYI